MAEVMRHFPSFSLGNAEIRREDPEQNLVLVTLNCALPKFTPELWPQVRLRVCADGGANRIYDELPTFIPHEDQKVVRGRYKPDVIVGDLDSIRPTVRNFYADLGTTIEDLSSDQDSTDFEKSIKYVEKTVDTKTPNLKILVVGALGGRFDHVAAHINVLYKFSSLRIVLLSDESSLYLLPQGFSHEISLNRGFEGPHCGLIPFGAPSESTTTTGLKWNLEGSRMTFGGLVSTSNLLDGDLVTVVSDTHLVWTVDLRDSCNLDGGSQA